MSQFRPNLHFFLVGVEFLIFGYYNLDEVDGELIGTLTIQENAMSDDRFKEGDVVELKSGSARMTVSGDYREINELECRWWNSSAQKFETDRFNPSELKKCDSDSGSAGGE